MTVSFPIYVYTAAKNIEEWLNPELIKNYIKEIEEELQTIVKILMGFAVVGWLLVFFSPLIGVSIFAGMLFLAFSLNGYYISIKEHQHKPSLQPFGGTCHFLPQGIHALSHKKENEIACNYDKMKHLIFCYKEHESEKILVIKWQYEGKDYQYMLKVDKREKELVALLSFLYEEKIPFREIDERGKKTYLLDLKIEKDKEIEAYQDLIDEIGKE